MARTGNSVNVEINAEVSGKESLRDFTARLDDLAKVAEGDLGKALTQASAKLNELGTQQAAVKTFEGLKREAGDAGAALKRAENELANYGRQITAIGAPTAAEADNLQRLQKAADDARVKFQQKNEVLAAAKGTLQQYGVAADNTQAAEQRLAAQIDRVKAEAIALAPALQGAGAAGKDSGDKIDQSMRGAGDAITSAKNQLLAFAGIGALSAEVKNVAMLADEWNNVRSRLQLALGAQTDMGKAMASVVALSQETYSSLQGTAELYGKIVTAGREFGVSQQQALSTTRTINQAIQLSGASAQASEAAITQLIQGLQSGVLRGDEFNSVMEQSPRLARAMADGLGVTLGQLRAMANEGKLTTDAVIRALQGQAAAIDKEFGALPKTIGRAVENLKTEWMKFIGTMNDSSGATGVIAAGIESLSKHLDDLARLATVTGAALTASYAIQAVQALRRFQAEMVATGGVAALLRTNLDKLSRPVQITIAVSGFEIGWQIGEMLSANFEWARKLGVGIVAFFESTINGLKLLKEAGEAIFTSDTIGAAMDRWKVRQKEIADITGDMWEQAKQSPAEVATAADHAAEAAKQMGAAAQGAGAAAAAAGTAGAAGMGAMTTAAATARDTLTALAQLINQKKPTDNGLAEIVRQLDAAAKRGVDLDQVLRKQLPDAIDKLSGPELAKFRAEFIRSLDEAGIKGKALATGLGLIGDQAATSLGVDVPLAMNKVSTSFVQSLDDLSVLIRTLPQLKAQGVDTATVVAAAMSKMIDGAKSQAELDAIKERVIALRKELGPLGANLLDQARDKAVELKNKLDDLRPGINSLDEAMRKLGLQTSSSLKQAADDAVQSFDVIKRAGQQEGESFAAWQARKSEAAKAMIERLIAANSGVADEATKTRAAIEGLTIEVDGTGRAFVRAMGDAAGAVNGTTNSINNQADALRRLRQLQQQGGVAPGVSPTAGKIGNFGDTIQTDENGRSAYQRSLMEKQGGPVDASYVFDLFARYQAGTLGESDLAAAQNALKVAKENARLGAAGSVSIDGRQNDQLWVNRLQQIVDSLSSGGLGGKAGGSGAGSGLARPASAGSGASASSSAAPSASRTININLGGVTTPVTVASEADAQQLELLLKRIAQAAGRSA